jgi:serine/threonine-protein kinase
MGVVYQAIDPTIGRTLAIKTIRLREVDDPAQRARLKERLFREARSAGVLSHPNIVTIYDMEEDDGVAYIAMQFVNGPTLDEVMSRPNPVEAQAMFLVLRQTAAALDFAHEKGIVHRDIKPANIMIDEHGTAKIADFGIAKVGTSGNLTLSGTILGTPNYMSPEQVQGKPVDGRADQFSLAVVSYEILTGERPFGGEHLGTVVYKIVAEEPTVAHRLNPTLSPEIDAVIQKALSKKADDRYKSCTEFINALEGACLHTEGWQNLARGTSHSIPTEAAPAGGRTRSTRAAAGRTSSDSKSRQKVPSMFFPALGAFVVVLGILALLAWQAGVWQPERRDKAPHQPAAIQEAAKTDPKPVAGTDDVETPPPTPVPAPVEPEPIETSKVETSTAKEQTSVPVIRKPEKQVAAKTIVPIKAAIPVVKIDQTPVGPDPQIVFVQTNPSGAVAALEGHSGDTCETPCTLLASPGVHILSLSLPNYQKEIRQVRVGDGREDVPLVTLRPNGGTLMISTNPPGANIFIDDKLQGSLTNAQIPLSPGTYQVVVERDGVRKSQRVEIKNGNTNYVRIILQ